MNLSIEGKEVVFAHGKDGNVFHDYHIIKSIFKDCFVDHILLCETPDSSYL